jgi:type IV secretory pathway VirB10-like protein
LAQTSDVQAPANELRPEPQTVEVQEETPATASNENADLDARERELAAREAELDARERRLHQAPRPPAAPRPPVAPRPEPEERRAGTTPSPAPEPAREEPRPEPEERAQTPEPEPEPRIENVTVPAGTQLDVEFTERLASNTNAPGETFRVRVTRDVMEDGEVAIPAGSEILGEVMEAVPLGRVGGQAKLELKFTDLVLPSGSSVPIDASFVQQGKSETGRDAATIGGGAAAGAILGRILNKGHRSKGAVIGAVIGAAAGTVIASRTPGEEVVFPAGSVVTLKLDDSVRVKVRR